MTRGAALVCGIAALWGSGGSAALGDSIPEIVVESNRIIARTNDIRQQAFEGKRDNGEAKRAVADLLSQLDDLDARAIRLCAAAPTAEDLASVADLILHGSLLQCLYALSAKDGEFEAGLGYETVYEQLVVLTEIDFRRDGAVNNPRELLDVFRGFWPPTTATPWISNGARDAFAALQAARTSVFAGSREPATLLSRLAEMNATSRAALDQFLRERNRDYLAVHLAGKFYVLEVCCFALMGFSEPANENWGRLANAFAECGNRAPLPPEALLDGFEPPEAFEEWMKGPQGWREILRQEILRLFDNFNHPQAWLWQFPPKREGRVIVERRNGRLTIRGLSDGRWRASGLWTKPREPMRCIFSVNMAGKGDGYYQHMRISGDTGAYVHLAYGGAWADTAFEVWRVGDGKPRRQHHFAKPPDAFKPDENGVHTGEIWYNPDARRVRAYLDGVLLGEAPVNLGQRVTYAIYCSSGKPVQYDAWFDNFRVDPVTAE